MSTLIVTGGRIDTKKMSGQIAGRQFDYIIAVDGGVAAAEEMHLMPTHIVGDFDTLPRERLTRYQNNPKVTLRCFCPEKDETDTEIAVRLATELECARKQNGEENQSSEDVLILGATGTRLDHTLANLCLLDCFVKAGISAAVWDANNRIALKNQSFTCKKSEAYGTYISFISLSPCVRGLTLRGFKYSLENHTLYQNSSLCVSNEFEAEEAEISFEDGLLFVIESMD